MPNEHSITGHGAETSRRGKSTALCCRGVGQALFAPHCGKPLQPSQEAVMRLAFVIPAYNEEALIGKCLESVIAEIARSGADAEVIVVNNASTDRTGEIARSYTGVRV
ncbi:MAG: glycosyltransferase family 2 protein, partial [Devosia sp.]